MATENESIEGLKPYDWCWLHTNCSYHYCGKLSSTKFVGNKLTVVFETIVDLVEISDGRPNKKSLDFSREWRALSAINHRVVMEFEGCKITKMDNPLRRQVKSRVEDVLVLTSDPRDSEVISHLISETMDEAATS